jgi:hypothetical protein
MYSELFMTLANLPVARLRPAGFLLLLSGWAIVVAAFRLLEARGPRAGFVLAGFAVELLGFALVVRSHGFVRRKKT